MDSKKIISEMTIIFMLHLLTIFAIIPTSGSANVDRYNSKDLNEDIYNEITYLLEQHAAKQRHQKQLYQQQEQQPVQTLRSGIPRAKYVENWPEKPLHIGQIAGIALNRQSQPVVFHRGPNVFDGSSFNGTHHYQYINDGPIKVPAILLLDPSNGSILQERGRNRFYLPHGITVDNDGNTWITDVALHQVMKFPPDSEEPSLVLGEAFVPGSDDKHFCKPTDVIVASSGEFFISDGYCNSRIQKYNPNGEIVAEWGHSAGRSIFAIPHSIALIEDQDLLCVADRENQRIQCFSAGLNPDMPPGKFVYQVSTKQIGRVYGIAYGGDGLLHGVAIGNEALGFTVDLDSGDIIDTWTPKHGFDTPHDIGVTQNGSNIYVGEIHPNRLSKFNFQ